MIYSTQGTPVQSMVDSLTSQLKPINPINQTYDQFSQAFQPSFNTMADQARQQFQTNTLNPYQYGLNNSIQGGNGNMVGQSQYLQGTAVRNQQIPFENQLASANQNYANQINQLYNQKISDLYNAPNAMTNQ